MKKQIVALVLAATVACGTSVQAFSADVLTQFNGANAVTGKFYTDIPFTNIKDMQLITGFQSTMYTKDAASRTSAILGVKFNAPVLGSVDLFGTFTFPGEVNSGDTEANRASVLKWVTLSKNWTARLADNLVAGVSIPLVKVNTSGTKEVSIMSEIQPQIGMRLDI